MRNQWSAEKQVVADSVEDGIEIALIHMFKAWPNGRHPFKKKDYVVIGHRKVYTLGMTPLSVWKEIMR